MNKPTNYKIIWYNQEVNLQNHYRENIFLYFPFFNDKNTLEKEYITWMDAFLANSKIVKLNEEKYMYNANESWENMDDFIHDIKIDKGNS